MHDEPHDLEPNLSDLDRQLVRRVRRAATSQHAPDLLRRRILSQLAASTQPAPRRRRVRWDLLAAGFGGALIASAATAALLMPRQSSPSVQFQPIELARHQVVSAAAWQTSEPTVLQTWLETEMAHQIQIPNIPNAQLVGGRITWVNGVRGAAMEYQTAGGGLTYLLVPDDIMSTFAQETDTVISWSEEDRQVVMWRQNGTTRALIAPLPPDDLSKIAEHCRRTMI